MADRTRAGTQGRATMKHSLLTLLGACGLLFLGAEAWAWQTNISGTAGGGQFNATAVDGAGNVVAAGYTNNTDTGNDFTVVKLDGANGAELWRHVISGNARTGFFFDVANTVAIDGAGNVVAAGVIWRECYSFPSNCGPMSDFLVVKLDGATGAELWRQNIENSFDDSDPTGVEDVANTVAIDGAGNVVAAGTLGYLSIVVKLDGAIGMELWRRFIQGSAGGRNTTNAVAVDEAGNVVAAGSTHNVETPGPAPDFAVVKLDGASGVVLWAQAIPGDAARAVAVDEAGNVVAAGSTPNTGTGLDFTVVKLDGASGAELWRQVTNNSAVSGPDVANAVAVDSAGNVTAAGGMTRYEFSTPVDFAVVKFEGMTGTELWRQIISGPNPNSDLVYANAVTVDADGNAIAAGATNNIFTVMKFDGASGIERWRLVLGNAGSSTVGARVVRVDRAGDVIAAGSVNGTATAVKLRGTDGSDFTPPDTEPPTVTMTAPANGAIVSGTVTVSADATDNIGVAGVQFRLDDSPLGTEDTEAPYSVTWNTSGTIVGVHKLKAVARDAAGNSSTSAPVTVTVVNLPSIGALP